MDKLNPLMVLGVKPKTSGGKGVWTVWLFSDIAVLIFSIVTVISGLISDSESKLAEQVGVPAYAASIVIGIVIVFWVIYMVVNLLFSKIYEVWERK